MTDQKLPARSTSPALQEAVAVMDRLRSPGGCPWDADQTHESLVRYLVEECYELVQAIEDGDRAAIQEELGDVLLQVLFHARIAQEDVESGFNIDEVAQSLVTKLISRHPHVFAAGETVESAADQQERWEELKRAEHGRSSALAGVAMAAPATALAGKLGARARKFGIDAELPTGNSIAEQIFRLAYEAGRRGEEPETALRAIARAHANRMLQVEGVAEADLRGNN